MQATWGGNVHQFQQRQLRGSNIQPFADGGGLVIPYTFVPGTVADANEVNADFNAVAAWAGTHGTIAVQSNMTLWASPAGVDAPGNGLGPASPFRTPTYAWMTLLNGYRLSNPGGVGPTITIQLAPGDYPGGAFSGMIPGQWNQNNVVIQGDVNNPGAYRFTDSVSVDHMAMCVILGVTFSSATPTGPSSAGTGLYANNSGFATFGSVVFGDCTGDQIWSQAGGIIRTAAPPNNRYTIAGSAQSHWRAQAAQIWISSSALSVSGANPGPTITIAGNPNFSNAFAVAGAPGGVIFVFAGTTFVNGQNVTGMQYTAHNNAAILTQTMPLPGNIPGTTYNNGIFDV